LDQPQRFLCSVNQLFCQNTSGGSFATLFFAEYDDTARRLRYINCGHLSHCSFAPMIPSIGLAPQRRFSALSRSGNAKWRKANSFPETLWRYTRWHHRSFSRIAKSLVKSAWWKPCAATGPSTVRTALFRCGEVRRFSPHEQHDDITLIVAKCLPH